MGREFFIIDSSISVAVITRLPRRRHFLIRYFCTVGTSTKGISTPRSPLATITPSATLQMESILSTPARFSIFAIISMSAPPLSSRNFLTARISSSQETKDAATKSISFSMPKRRSALSCSPRYSCFRVLFGKFMLFLFDTSPPAMTLQ